MTSSFRSWFVLLALLLCACTQEVVLGAVGCDDANDCQPPSTICGPDGRCIPGCVNDPSGCPAGATCDTQSGECGGGPIGVSCADDLACDAPDLVCRASSHTCVAGCTISGVCDAGMRCDVLTGHCCDASSASCTLNVIPSSACLSDEICTDDTKGDVCTNGICTRPCATTGCTSPQLCNTSDGHCEVGTCTRDVDCDATSFCNASGKCALLPGPVPGPCSGGHALDYHCASEDAAAELASCAGASGPAACPYCIDGACFFIGLCSSANDCHRDDTCEAGLCLGASTVCSSTVTIADVIAGHFGVGKQVCVEGTVKSVRSGYDGLIELELDSGSFVFADVPPAYKNAGIALPEVGQDKRVHGTVRWDAGHADWEISPVDWISP